MKLEEISGLWFLYIGGTLKFYWILEITFIVKVDLVDKADVFFKFWCVFFNSTWYAIWASRFV